MNNPQPSIDKLLFQLVIIAASFFGIWFLLSRINFVDDEDASRFAREKEKKLGEMILESITSTSEEIESPQIKAVLDSIAKRICEANDLDCSQLKIHLIRSSEVNAFALPDHHMVIYTGLIDYTKNAEELAGVMAHEIGHMEKNHVMKKLTKEIGLAMLFTIAGGNGGMEVLKEATRVVSSTAFDRSQETEADMYAVEMLAKANIDPEHLGNVLFRLSLTVDIPKELVWISTHPDSKDRAAEILNKRKEYNFTPKEVISLPWTEVQQMAMPGESYETVD